jgi:hypothetical protein
LWLRHWRTVALRREVGFAGHVDVAEQLDASAALTLKQSSPHHSAGFFNFSHPKQQQRTNIVRK